MLSFLSISDYIDYYFEEKPMTDSTPPANPPAEHHAEVLEALSNLQTLHALGGIASALGHGGAATQSQLPVSTPPVDPTAEHHAEVWEALSNPYTWQALGGIASALGHGGAATQIPIYGLIFAMLANILQPHPAKATAQFSPPTPEKPTPEQSTSFEGG